MAGTEEGEGRFEHIHVKIKADGFVEDVRPLLDRRMAEMDQNVGVGEGVERKVAGAVAGIAADDHPKARTAECGGYLRRLSRESGGELESNAPRSTLMEPLNKVGDRYQRHAPASRRPQPGPGS